jgi:hypothetical protein
MLVRQLVGRYAGREFDMTPEMAIANHRAGVVEILDPMPKSTVQRLEDAGKIEAEAKVQIKPRRGPGRPRKSIAQAPVKLAGDLL